MSVTESHSSADTRTGLPARLPWVLALLASLGAVAVAVTWLVAPDTYPYGSGDVVRTGLNYLIEREPASAMLLAFAVAGLPIVVIALLGGASRTALRVAAAGAVAETLFFAFVMSDGSIMPALAYAIALVAPAGMAVAVVLVCRRSRRATIVLASLVLVLGIVGFVSGALARVGEAAATYLGGLLSDPESYYPRMAWSLGMAVGAACWAWAAIASLREVPSDHGPDKRWASWATAASARRWGKGVTIAAAMCPVPYGFARLTWLTPWPLGGPGVDELVISRSLDAATRLQGSLFAGASAVGVILTLGLISGWGEVFPRWFPLVGGRAVPVMQAVVPATLVAVAITMAAPGILLGPIATGDPREIAYSLIAFPFPVWGPLLGAATFAYWLRRTESRSVEVPQDAA